MQPPSRSAYYKAHHNFFPFSSGGLKSDFNGHDNRHFENVYINSHNCVEICAQAPGHEDAFYNNTCILPDANPGQQYDYAHFQGSKPTDPGLPRVHSNRVFTPSGLANESGLPIRAWHDRGTTVARLPPDDVILAMARAVLQLPAPSVLLA